MWDSLSDEQRLQFFTRFVGVTVNEINMNVIYQAENFLSPDQIKLYADYCSGEVSTKTYTTHQVNAPDTVYFFYFNMLHLDARSRAKMLWHAVNGVAP